MRGKSKFTVEELNQRLKKLTGCPDDMDLRKMTLKEVEDLMNDDIQKEIEDLAFKIDGILANNKQYDEGILTEVEYLIDSNTPEDASFKPVYVVFALIKEELELNGEINN